MLKKIGFAIIGLLGLALAIVLGLAALKPDQYMISRSLLVDATAERVYAEIGEIASWERWSPWKAKDPSIQNTYVGPPSGVGATQSWTSQKSGSGTLAFTEVVPTKRVRYQLVFKDWDSKSEGELRLEPVSDGRQTQVTWTMEGEHRFMDKVFWVVFQFERAISKDFDHGLSLLKGLAERLQ